MGAQASRPLIHGVIRPVVPGYWVKGAPGSLQNETPCVPKLNGHLKQKGHAVSSS